LDEAGGTTLRVKMGRLIPGIKRINKLTNDNYARKNYRNFRRNSEWAKTELQELLTKCTTFTEKVTVDTVLGELATPEERAEAEAQRIAAEEARKKYVQAQLDKVKAIKLFERMEIEREKAIKRSELFLENAIKQTKAELVMHNGNEAYLVKGNLRSYIVMKETGQVFEAKSKKYICIVNSNHYKGVGYDSIASRLLGLRNDSMIENIVGTLRNAGLGVDEDVDEIEVDEDEVAELEAEVA
jgi:hypothetical protein